MIPERSNLSYHLITGPSSPSNILELPFITNFLLEDLPGLIMIYVQSIEDGTSIFFDIYQFSASNHLIDFPTRKSTPEKNFAFLHSNLSEEVKRNIIKDAQNMKIKILISTSSAGAGVHLPISCFIGWGLDREPSGVVQASGRTARGQGEVGDVLWIHNPKLHGRRVSSKSRVRELLQPQCIRAVLNSWFCEGVTSETAVTVEQHSCCSSCMKECAETTDCIRCTVSLDSFRFNSSDLSKNKPLVTLFCDFLKSLNIAERCPEAPLYSEESLAKTIFSELNDAKDVSGTISFLEIFSLGDELSRDIGDFIQKELFQPLDSDDICATEKVKVDSSSDSEKDDAESLSESGDSCEYFDETND